MSTDPRIEAAAQQVAVETGYPESNFPDGMAKTTAKHYRDKAARILTAADKAVTITSLVQLGALPDGSAFIDKGGDIGVVQCGYVHYPETDPLGIDYVAKRYLPARIIHWGTE